MTVIKQDQLDGGSHRLGSIEIEDFDRRAETLVQEARDAACAIIESARAQAAELLEAARATGREAGHAEGLEQGRVEGRTEAVAAHGQRFEELSAAWSTMLQQWQAERDAMFRGAEQDVVALAVRLAGQIVHRTIRIDSGVIRSQLEAAMSMVRSESDLVVVIAPDDEPLVAELLDELMASFGNCRDATIRVEPGLTPGGCRIELDGGVIDASLETQLQRMATLLQPDEPVRQVADDHGA